MTTAQTTRVYEKDLETCRLSALVYDVSAEMDTTDLQSLIRRRMNSSDWYLRFGKVYSIDDRKFQLAFINFKNEESVDAFVKGGSIFSEGHEMRLSRYLPKCCPLRNHFTSNILLKIDDTTQTNRSQRKIPEFDLRKHFAHFGPIVNCSWRNANEVILQFENSDVVNRIILSGISRTIRGINVNVEKTLLKPMNTCKGLTLSELPCCIHVTDIPANVTSEELGKEFSIHVAEILFRPADSQNTRSASANQSTGEAWIKHLSDRRLMEDFVKKYSRTTIRGMEMSWDIIQEPFSVFDLCRDFENDDCQYSSERCNYKHILCEEADQCMNFKCWFGHSKKRTIKSSQRPFADTTNHCYRARLSNIPSDVTNEELTKRLKIPSQFSERIKFSDEQTSNPFMVVYVTDQVSEKLLRKKIHEWHNTPYSPDLDRRMKCQLERNTLDFDYENDNDVPETSDLSRTSSMSSNRSFSWHRRQENGIQVTSTNANNTIAKKSIEGARSEAPVDLFRLAPQWRWTGEKLFDDPENNIEIYSLVAKNNRELFADIKIYRTDLNPTVEQIAQRENFILDKLKGINGIPKMLVTNIDSSSANQPWIITEHIKGRNLLDYVKCQSMNLHENLIITRKLLHLIKDIHSRNIVHRYIHPKNILVTIRSRVPSNRSHHDVNQVNLHLIDFSEAYPAGNEEITQGMGLQSDSDHRQNSFYQPPQLQRQPSIVDENDHPQNEYFDYHPSIDTSFVCAILFWLVTKHYPRDSQDIDNVPTHRQAKYSEIIDKESIRAAGIWTNEEKYVPLKQHLHLIFDRGFGLPKDQWSIEELQYQVDHLLQLTTMNDEENRYLPPPLSQKQIESSLFTSLKSNSFLQLASLIESLKRQFTARYPIVQWSTDEKCQWKGHSYHVQVEDSLTFHQNGRYILIETCCSATIRKNGEVEMIFKAKSDPTGTKLIVSLGIWKDFDQDNTKKNIYQIFELQMKIFIEILYQRKII